MNTTTPGAAPNNLVRGLRYRRWLGRHQLVRGKIPSRPRIKYGLAPGCLGIVLIIVAIYVIALIAVAIQMALYVVVAFAALLVVRPFYRFAVAAVKGGVFNAGAFAETPATGMFVLGAVPTTALVYPLSHGIATLAGAAVVGGVGFRPLVRALDGKPLPTLPLRKRVDATPSVAPDLSEAGDFGLWIGEATSTFAALGHTAGLQRGSNVTLNLRDAAKNIAIFGETGTGKTTRVINHLLVQALDFDCGGLIFDVRGDFHTTALHAAQLTGKTIRRIGVGELGLNLLDGLTPNTAAGILEAAFKLLGQGEGDSAFWLSLAVARSQAALAVLFHVSGAYSLKGLYDYVFDERSRKDAIATAGDSLLELQVRAADGDRDASLDARRLKSAIDYEATIATQYTDKERSGVNRTIETALARFADPELEDAFCTDTGDQANLADVLNGAVFIVNVPRERFKAAASVVYLFVKERFFQDVNTRAQLPAGPRKSRPLLFLCDEYQQICSAGDAQFFDTSRALGVIGIVAAQSIEAYIAAIGNEHAATALLGNFTNVVAFRSTERTMNYVAGKLGEVDVWKETFNTGRSDKPTIFFPHAASVSEGHSASTQRQRLLTAQTFRGLGPDQAVALLTVDGTAFDDVLSVPQLTDDDLESA